MDQLKQCQDNQHHAMFRYLIVWYVKVVHTEPEFTFYGFVFLGFFFFTKFFHLFI